MSSRLHRFDDIAAAASALAAAVSADLQAALALVPRALLLVSGGHSPVVFFQRLAAMPLDWQRIDVSLVDERSVAANDAAANARLVQENLLTGAAAQARWLPLLPPNLFDASDTWAAACRAAAGANADMRLAHPAVIVLGLGNDGHTASLFADAPQWPQARSTEQRYLALQPGIAPHARISLSLHALRAQSRCYLWAVGPDKAATLARLQHAVSINATGMPGAASEVAPGCGPVLWLLADPSALLEIYCAEAG